MTLIAKFFGVSMAVLVFVNHLTNGDHLTVGQVLQIPPRQPVRLVVMPFDAAAGDSVMLTLTGAQGNETVSFEIDAPDGHKFTGPPHLAAVDGSVTATYQTNATSTTVMYTAVAKGDHGTSARAMFRVHPSSPST